MSKVLFSTYRLGRMELPNRVVMAPMTRSRSPGNIPTPLVATYYAQRAEAGLIITEGTSPAPSGLGYLAIPGLFSTEHVKAWKGVTDAVHRAGGRIFVQLMHTGRVGHPANLPPDTPLLAPSALAAPGNMFTVQGELPHPVPQQMTHAEVQQAIEKFAHGAQLAMEAGFDGVELHGANGYLIEQFLNTASNQRTDAWGGSVTHRIRFAVEVAREAAARIGADRVGMRLSPYGVFNGMQADPTTHQTYESLATELSRLDLLYVHLVDHSSMGAPPVPNEVKRAIRERFRNTLILSGGYDGPRAESDLVEKRAELIAFGRPFISNPRLVTKLKNGSTLREADRATMYGGGEKGYTDYPMDD